MGPVTSEKLLREAQDRLKKCVQEDEENRKLALEDLEFAFVEGKQWPEAIKAEREGDGRPCITINKLPTFINQVVGDQRMNRPSIKVIPVDSVADPKVAQLLGGWIKHVQNISKSDIAIDHAFEHACASGYGAMRVVTKYTSDSAFEQEAFIEKIENALAVFYGPHSEYDCSDMQYCFVVTDMDREEFEDKYGKENTVAFNYADAQYVDNWATKDKVRVAEYFVKEPKEKTIYLLADGRVVETLSEGDQEVRRRKVQSYIIKWYLLSGNKVLDEKTWLGKKYIPIVPVWGQEANVGGKRRVRSLIRFAKDPQRMYNYWNSSDTESVALQPKSPYLVTPKQISGHEGQWKEAHRKNYPYLLVNFDEKSPGWPSRQMPPQASSAMAQKLAQADQEIRDTIGLQKAALGMQSNERSGAAIRERKKEGDVGTFSFIDNLTRSIEHLGRILVDIAPALLDTERIVRLGLEDGGFDFDAVNVQDPQTGKILNDLSTGTYDVVVKVGPSFTTQREEAQQSMQQFLQYYPQAAPLIGDLYAKANDWVGSEEVSHRLEFLLPPEIKAEIAAKKAKAGIAVPPPAAPPQPPPDPTQVLKLEEEKLKLQEMQVKLRQEEVKLAELQLKVELMGLESREGVKKLIDEIALEEAQAFAQSQGQGGQPGTSPVVNPSGGGTEQRLNSEQQGSLMQ